MSFGEWIIVGMFFVNACALYMVALHSTRVRDNQAEMRDEMMLLRAGQMHQGNIVHQGPRLIVVKHPLTQTKMHIHCWNGQLTYRHTSDEEAQEAGNDAA